MNIEKLTQKSQEALSRANELAVELNHQEIAPLHAMAALIGQENGFIGAII